MTNVISKQNYQRRAKRIWQDILRKESLREKGVSQLCFQLARLERQIAMFRSWEHQSQ